MDYGVTIKSFIEDSLPAGHPTVTMWGKLAGGVAEVVFKRGTVLADVGGELVGYDPDGADGSETAGSILAEDATVPVAGVSCIAYVHGSFNAKSLVWTHEGITDLEKAAALSALKAAGIYCM